MIPPPNDQDQYIVRYIDLDSLRPGMTVWEDGHGWTVVNRITFDWKVDMDSYTTIVYANDSEIHPGGRPIVLLRREL